MNQSDEQSEEQSKKHITDINLVKTPSDSLFARDYMRKGQYDFYMDALMACENAKILLANAPTGIGKTSASLSAVLKHSIPNSRKVFFLTNRIPQHLQVIIELKQIIKNRQNIINTLRPDDPTIKVIDKISKDRMCNRLFGSEQARPAFLLCEISHCPYQNPKRDDVQVLLDSPIHALEANKLGIQKNFCAHQGAMLASSWADLIVCDYSYIFNPDINRIIFQKIGVNIADCDIIVDEAHNLPKRIRSINEHEINEDSIKNAFRGLTQIRKLAESTKNKYMLEQAMTCARHLRMIISANISVLIYEDINLHEEFELKRLDLAFLKEKMASLDPNYQQNFCEVAIDLCDFFMQAVLNSKEEFDYDGVASFRELIAFLIPASEFAWGNKKWGVFLKRGQNSMYSLRAVLFDPSEISRQVFSQVHSAILMSGTLSGKKQFCELLSIKNACGLQIDQYESPFDKKRQPISVCSQTSSRYEYRSNNSKMDLMAKIIENASKSVYPHSFAIYYPSYEFMQKITDRLSLDGFELIKEDKSEKNIGFIEKKMRLDGHKKSKKPIAFNAVIGAKYNEGLDFMNNPFKLMIIAGFPYPKKSASHTAYEKYLQDKLKSKIKAHECCNILPAVDSVLQTMGRGIRQPTDWCYCLLIDDRFEQYKTYFPKDIQARMKNLAWDKIEQSVKDFAFEVGGF